MAADAAPAFPPPSGPLRDHLHRPTDRSGVVSRARFRRRDRRPHGRGAGDARVLQDLAYIGYLVEQKAPEGPYFEAAVIHHTDCGSGLLADEELRRGFAARGGYDEAALAELPVLDPEQTVREDVERVLRAPEVSQRITVSGHVYDVADGRLRTVVPPAAPGA